MAGDNRPASTLPRFSHRGRLFSAELTSLLLLLRLLFSFSPELGNASVTRDDGEGKGGEKGGETAGILIGIVGRSGSNRFHNSVVHFSPLVGILQRHTNRVSAIP